MFRDKRFIAGDIAVSLLVLSGLFTIAGAVLSLMSR